MITHTRFPNRRCRICTKVSIFHRIGFSPRVKFRLVERAAIPSINKYHAHHSLISTGNNKSICFMEMSENGWIIQLTQYIAFKYLLLKA